jgi:hypothetical protein
MWMTGKLPTGKYEGRAGDATRGCAALPIASLLPIFLSVIFLSLFCNRSQAQETAESEQAVQEAGEALQQSGKYPWYDASKDGVKPIPLATSSDADSENRDSKWTAQPKAATLGPLPQISFLGWLFNWIGITLLIVFLALIAWLVAKAFLKDEVSEGVARKVIETSRDVDRVEALPFKLRKPTSNFLDEARRLYEAGDYSEAIIYFFSYQLVELDRHHLIRLAKGKTNRQYLREVRPRPNLHSILGITIVVFEDAFFGRKTITREHFERSWNRLSEFQSELDRLERAAA